MNTSRIIQRFTCALEARMHRRASLFKLYMLPYGRVVSREAKMANVMSDDLVLNIGCGSVPSTAVLIHKLTGAKVVAMDNDEEAVAAARKVVSKIGLEHGVDVVLGDGLAPIAFPFNKVFAALHVEPKDDLVKNIMACSEEAVLVLRMPRRKLAASYGAEDLSLPPRQHVSHMMPTFDRSLLITG